MSSVLPKSVLPRVGDSWSFVYIEHAHLERDAHALVIDRSGVRARMPSAQFLTVMAGPGTSITQAASMLLAERGCNLVWCGESGVRFYGSAHAETHATPLLERQVMSWADMGMRAEVARRMYRIRFPSDPVNLRVSIAQLRGREGARMRAVYAQLASQYAIEWHGRDVDQMASWGQEPIQQAISVANSCLYGICHAAIVSLGLSPALGFVHHGNQRSFVWDVADLYKVAVTLPIAFAEAAAGSDKLATRVRRACREVFYGQRIIERIVADVYALFEATEPRVQYIDMQRDFSEGGGEEC